MCWRDQSGVDLDSSKLKVIMLFGMLFYVPIFFVCQDFDIHSCLINSISFTEMVTLVSFSLVSMSSSPCR